MENKNELSPPKQKASDIAHTIVKGGLGAIPIVGAPAAEIFNLLVSPPIEKRKNEWMEKISQRLIDLEAKQSGFIESLKNNDTFINILLSASQSAIRNNHKEKLDALENVVINSALPDAPEEVYQQIYLSLIDDLSTMHVKVLKETSGTITNTTEELFLSRVFSDFLAQKELYLHVWNDLLSKQLIHVMKNANKALNISRTKLGNGFINFITKKQI